MSAESTDGDLRRLAYDREAFAAFYREHVDQVQRFLARRVNDPHEVADLTADVFLAVIESAHGYRKRRGEPVAWLYGIARNVLASYRRKDARGLAAGNRVAGRALVDEDDEARLLERIDAETQARRLYLAMDELSDAERAVLELVALDGLSVSDAAAALGIRSSAARVRLHRARRQLREHLVRALPQHEWTPSEVTQ